MTQGKRKGKLVAQKSAKGVSIDRVAIRRVCEQAHAGFETEAARCDAPGHGESRAQSPGRHSMQGNARFKYNNTLSKAPKFYFRELNLARALVITAMVEAWTHYPKRF